MAIPDPATTDWVPIWNPMSEGPVGPPGPPAGPHHATHEPGGTDALVNAAWTNLANVFTQVQKISTPTIVELQLEETIVPTLLRIINYQSKFQIYYNPVGALFVVDLAGNIAVRTDIYEKGRSAALGHWIDTPFNAAHYSASGSMTWTVVSGGTVNRYSLIGKTMIWNIILGPATIGGTLSNILIIQLPPGFSTLQVQAVGQALIGGLWESVVVAGNGTQITINRYNSGNFPAGSMYFAVQITLTLP